MKVKYFFSFSILIALLLCGCSVHKSALTDTDGDGIVDRNDVCPEVAGFPKYKGCPIFDTDGDGVEDSDDHCPDVPGSIENNGCSNMTVEARGLKKKSYTVVKTYFGTDRKIVITDGDAVEFSGERAKNVNYGYCNVSIPKDHEEGEIERPFWSFNENPEKHIVVLKKEMLSKGEYIVAINETISEIEEKDILVFVHGYNVTFDDAARRTAQMSHDLNFPGVPMFYSWPSQGGILGFTDYTLDGENIEWSEKNIRNFILDLTSKIDCNKIYLIGHSMGTRALTKVVANMPIDPNGNQKKIKEVILAAPDIDAEIFKTEIAPNVTTRFDNVTMYTSADDLALKSSKLVNSGPRAGDSENGILYIDGIETIDATGLNTGFLNHSYFGDSGTLIRDIIQLFKDGKRAEERFGLEKQVNNTWLFSQ